MDNDKLILITASNLTNRFQGKKGTLSGFNEKLEVMAFRIVTPQNIPQHIMVDLKNSSDNTFEMTYGEFANKFVEDL